MGLLRLDQDAGESWIYVPGMVGLVTRCPRDTDSSDGMEEAHKVPMSGLAVFASRLHSRLDRTDVRYIWCAETGT